MQVPGTHRLSRINPLLNDCPGVSRQDAQRPCCWHEHSDHVCLAAYLCDRGKDDLAGAQYERDAGYD